MKFKKLLFILLLTIFFVNVGYSVTYLNSCGKSSGWINGETYVLNFTSTDFTNSNYFNTISVPSRGYYCFVFDTTYNNILFTSNNNSIKMNFISQLTFNDEIALWGTTDVYNHQNITFKDIVIYKDEESYNNFGNGFVTSLIGNDLRGTYNINNVKSYGLESITRQQGVNIITLNVENSLFLNLLYGLFHSQNTDDNIFITNSFLHGERRLNYFYRGYFIINNSVISFDDDNLTGIYNANSRIENSILKGTVGTDTNNDGVYDVDIIPSDKNAGYYQNLRFYKDLLGYRFLKDSSGDSTIFILNNVENVFIENDVLGVINLQSNRQLNTYPASYNLNGYNRIILQDDTVYKSFDYTKTFLSDSNESTLSSTDTYRGLVGVNGDNVNITGLDYYKYYSNNNAQMIANFLPVPKNNVNIYGNTFYKNDTFVLGGNNNNFISLFGTNLNVYDNTFFANNSGGLFGYQFLGIDSSNPSTNNVYLNKFETDVLTFSLVFNDPTRQDTNFYNNYIGSKVNISLYDNTLLNINPLVPYLYTDNKVYYFYIGNYYEDNTGCVDSDFDGICDNPYISGNVIDNYPIVSYPYNFDLYLSNAVSETDLNENVVINVFGVTQNDTVTLQDFNDLLEIGFNHNSTFNDLICYYTIDNVIVTNTTTTNTPSNTLIQYNLTGFNEQGYSFQVECYNNFKLYSSDYYDFDVVYGANVTPPDNGGGVGDDVTNIFSGGTGLFTGDIDDTNEGLKGLFGVLETPIGYLIILGAMVLLLVLVFTIFSLIRYSVTGGSK